jgi:hypothetical protein
MTFGHYPLTSWCDNTGECLAVKLRSGNAGSNTVSDHLEVLTESIRQIPAAFRRDLLITCDGAGATIDLIKHITTLNAAPGRKVHYSMGSTSTNAPGQRSHWFPRAPGSTPWTPTATPATSTKPAWWS